jgi:hypothetical protein
MWAQDNVYTPTLNCLSGICEVEGANETGACAILGVNIYAVGGYRFICLPSLTYFANVALCGDGSATCVLRKGSARYDVCFGHPESDQC